MRIVAPIFFCSAAAAAKRGFKLKKKNWSCDLKANKRPWKKLHEKGTDIYMDIIERIGLGKESAKKNIFHDF